VGGESTRQSGRIECLHHSGRQAPGRAPAQGETAMTRRSALALAVLAALSWAAVARADEKKAAEDKPMGFIGVGLSMSADGGIQIDEAIKDGPAEKAGVKAGDVVKKLNGKEVKDLEGFVSQVRTAKVGDKLKITVSRDGKDMELTITVAKRPAEP